MHFLITGHTGFKGSWLAQLLVTQGHEVSGISLNPSANDLFSIANLSDIFKYDFRQDIRNYDELEKLVKRANPDVLIHFAAQPLVIESYRDPITTYETNVNGTLNVLQASEKISNVKARLIITTDKVYRITGKKSGYIETDPLGGIDPYSASKAMADILAQAWGESTLGAPIAVVRAGNVIGGGDFAQNRIMTDLVGAFVGGNRLQIRSPNSVRPWQHVLDCLSGYLRILDNLLTDPSKNLWNIGPNPISYKSVSEVLMSAQKYWGKSLDIDYTEPKFLETTHLTLDSTRAFKELGWIGTWDFDTTINRTIGWYKSYSEGANPRKLCIEDISEFHRNPISAN